MFSDTQILHRVEGGNMSLPTLFTYPFQYTPHPLCVKAADELKAYIRSRQDWSDEVGRGKMFGVLIVKSDADQGVYYLAAFSGLLDGKNLHEGFVPAVFDLQQNDEYFQQEDAIISAMPNGEEKSERSRRLQLWLFSQFNFLNAHGESRNLLDIFDHERCRIPPSGAGECCAPKLLQYAYTHHLHPVCMAEFWLGASPKGEIRRDSEYYPACHSKCKPILRHMLVGLNVEENPLLPMMRTMADHMRIIYDDPWLLAVDKPAGMLSVRGNVDAPSVEARIQETYPDITGPLIVHRLDMDTSGVMIVAKNKDIHKALQIQFYKHEIRKRYVAMLDTDDGAGTPDAACANDGKPALADHGRITLPLCPSHTDRPRQMVSWEHGKEAVTDYEVVGQTNGHLRIHFFPLTGRTHQLRVHAAHPDGLCHPILGDRLYGREADRLYLHAESIDFVHPVSGKSVHLEVPAPF